MLSMTARHACSSWQTSRERARVATSAPEPLTRSGWYRAVALRSARWQEEMSWTLTGGAAPTAASNAATSPL